MIEVCHGIEAYRQPSPARNPGGDCFACALTAALRWLYPEQPVEFDDVFLLFESEHHDPHAQANLQRLREAVAPLFNPVQRPRTDDDVLDCGKFFDQLQQAECVYIEVSADRPSTTVSNVWGRGGMGKALGRAGQKWGDGWSAIDVQYDIVDRNFDVEIWSHAWYWQEPAGEWARRLERWLRAGYVAFAEQKFAGTGPVDAELRHYSSDHFVLIDGVRLGWEPSDHGRSWNEYAHVVCSVRGSYWISVSDLMRKHGTAGLMLARRMDDA